MTTDLDKKAEAYALKRSALSIMTMASHAKSDIKWFGEDLAIVEKECFKSGYEQGTKDAEVLVAKNIFAGFCLSSRDTAEKEILCQVIDKLYPAIRLPKQEEQDD